ncbi:hypothetical protein HN858_03685 [Candidatus Falkowbacteria bacterium]|jgi:hypothetical protein|nr:hypothetical protein [Candidatus Falkowbacteria bacterium]MBT5503700.1 hypothetical protein [Candidatus Falkowbacteria bacterium]MBT6573820.1 hypothetical protein [Candidatus Falkowbacteria bacterium]MBT7348752.1 hypothetical protein [Candidatus Falkowbacteria bacterium]MBT7500542.1 hypothetical protein [Candidatus Falkowbacteria bacterium]
MSRHSKRHKSRKVKEYDPHRVMREIARTLIGSKPRQVHSGKKGQKGYDRKRERAIPNY